MISFLPHQKKGLATHPPKRGPTRETQTKQPKLAASPYRSLWKINGLLAERFREMSQDVGVAKLAVFASLIAQNLDEIGVLTFAEKLADNLLGLLNAND